MCPAVGLRDLHTSHRHSFPHTSQAPTPFLMGMHPAVELEGRSTEHVVVVDLDRWGRGEGRGVGGGGAQQ